MLLSFLCHYLSDYTRAPPHHVGVLGRALGGERSFVAFFFARHSSMHLQYPLRRCSFVSLGGEGRHLDKLHFNLKICYVTTAVSAGRKVICIIWVWAGNERERNGRLHYLHGYLIVEGGCDVYIDISLLDMSISMPKTALGPVQGSNWRPEFVGASTRVGRCYFLPPEMSTVPRIPCLHRLRPQ